MKEFFDYFLGKRKRVLQNQRITCKLKGVVVIILPYAFCRGPKMLFWLHGRLLLLLTFSGRAILL